MQHQHNAQQPQHHLPSDQQGKFGLEEGGRTMGGLGEGGSGSAVGTGDATGADLNAFNRQR